MVQKLSSRAILLLFAMLFLLPSHAYCAEQNPEQFIKEFYTWYITTNEGRQLAIKNGGIYTYVARDTVEKVKVLPQAYGSDRRDYFLKTADGPLNMSGVTIDVEKVTDMGADTYVTAVTITSTYPDRYRSRDYIVVIIKKINGVLKITKCIDIYPEA